MSKLYSYVGPRELLALVNSARKGTVIGSGGDVADWMVKNASDWESGEEVFVTYVISQHGELRIADRHSEHVVCAGGEAVRAAGEMSFLREGGKVMVNYVTNQSTGYCPEPESWGAVEEALAATDIDHPPAFIFECIFRTCKSCGALNLVKDEWFVCQECNSDLDR